MTKAEGRNEKELLQILDSKLRNLPKGESFKTLIVRRRRENPPQAEQQAVAKAYAEWKAEANKPKSNPPASGRRSTYPLVGHNPVTPQGDPIKERKVPLPEIKQPRKSNLILHCGATAVPRMEVSRVSTPRPTETWQPIPHIALIEEVEDALRSTGMRIGEQVHSLTQDGARYFGLTQVHGRQNDDQGDYTLIVGLRNSHDRTLPVGLVAGAQVFVCDNLSFSGEVRLSRRHTVHLQRDLPQLVASGVGKLMDLWGHQSQRIDAYKNHRMRDKAAHDLVIRAVDLGACTNRAIPAVIKEWRKPTYPDFKDRTAWSLFNAFAEVLKGNLPELPKRTESLHALFDKHVGTLN